MLQFDNSKEKCADKFSCTSNPNALCKFGDKTPLRSAALLPRKGIRNSQVTVTDARGVASLDIFGQFPELQECSAKDEREKLIRKFHATQMSLQVYPFASRCPLQRKYRIGGLLGDGTFGFVLRATNIFTNQSVAIKFISKQSSKKCRLDEDGIPLEIKILSKCNHPNIVKYYEHYEDSNYFILVTEHFGHDWGEEGAQEKNLFNFVPTDPVLQPSHQFIQNLFSSSPIANFRNTSADLFECIESHQRIPETTIKKIINQLLRVMQYLRDEIKCSHSDIKDENILIDAQYNIKLIDFGSALSSNEACFNLTSNRMKFFGTLQFAAPEVLIGNGYYGNASDLWSVGSLLYLMITGDNYLTNLVKMGKNEKGATVYSFKLADLIEIMNILDDIELYDFLVKLLNEDPGERISIEDAISHSWLQEGTQQFIE